MQLSLAGPDKAQIMAECAQKYPNLKDEGTRSFFSFHYLSFAS
jgi:hypothetical protein